MHLHFFELISKFVTREVLYNNILMYHSSDNFGTTESFILTLSYRGIKSVSLTASRIDTLPPEKHSQAHVVSCGDIIKECLFEKNIDICTYNMV